MESNFHKQHSTKADANLKGFMLNPNDIRLPIKQMHSCQFEFDPRGQTKSMFKITIETHFNIERFMSKNIRNAIMVKPEYWEGGGIAVGVHQGGEQEGQQEHHLLFFGYSSLSYNINPYYPKLTILKGIDSPGD